MVRRACVFIFFVLFCSRRFLDRIWNYVELYMNMPCTCTSTFSVKFFAQLVAQWVYCFQYFVDKSVPRSFALLCCYWLCSPAHIPTLQYLTQQTENKRSSKRMHYALTYDDDGSGVVWSGVDVCRLYNGIEMNIINWWIIYGLAVSVV